MTRPGHPLTLKTLLMKRSLKELPSTSASKSLLFKALDMAEDTKSKDVSNMIKSPIKVPFSFSPLSPNFHISVIPIRKVSPKYRYRLNFHEISSAVQMSYLSLNSFK